MIHLHRAAAPWGERLARGAGATLLALEMGVGKTLVALMVLAALAAKRILICCPLRVVPVWEQQIERHLDLPVIVVTLDDNIGSVANKMRLAGEKLKLAEATDRPLIVIINYDSAWRAPFAEWARRAGCATGSTAGGDRSDPPMRREPGNHGNDNERVART